MMTTNAQKAKLRGVSHNFAAVAAAAAGTMLTIDAPTADARFGCAIYSFCIVFMFSMSALYHIPKWSPDARTFMRRLDHTGIYSMIAGTYTPLCLLALDSETGHHLLKIVWAGAFLGIAFALFGRGGAGSKVLSAIIYVALGWSILPYASQMNGALGTTATSLIVAGGIVYSVGAVIYAARWPDPYPLVWGYHEVFHAFVILAAILHFIAIKIVVKNIQV